MSIGVLLRGFIGDMMDFGDVILRTLFPSFMIIQACTYMLYSGNTPPSTTTVSPTLNRNGNTKYLDHGPGCASGAGIHDRGLQKEP
jgi:hypothetical protein